MISTGKGPTKKKSWGMDPMERSGAPSEKSNPMEKN